MKQRRQTSAGRKTVAAVPGTDADPSGRTWKLEWIAGVAAAIVAIALHVTFLTHAGALWRDEINSVNTQRAASVGELWRLEEFDSFPLLWLLLLKTWTAAGAGSTDFGLRVFGVLCGLALPAAVWFAARRFRGGVPLVSLALAAVNPEIIRWGASVRAWGLGAALAIVAAVLMLDVVDSIPRRRQIVAALVAIASVQCVYQNAVFVAASVVSAVFVAAWRRDWTATRGPLAIGAAAALSLIPYGDVLRRRDVWNLVSQGPVTLGDLAVRAEALFRASGSLAFAGWIALAVAAVVLGIRASRVRSLSEERRRRVALYAPVTMTASLAGLTAFYLWFRYPTQSWYYIGLAGIVAAMAEATIVAALPSRSTRMALGVAALVVMAASFESARANLQERQTNIDVLGAAFSADTSAGDLILVNPWYLAITLERYYHGPAVVMSIPPIIDHTVHRYDLLKAEMLSSDATAPIRARVQQVLESGHRVWLLGALDAAPEGVSLPALPAPPLPESGWSSAPYESWWMLQVAGFLRQHALTGRRIAIDTVGGRLEDATLTVVSGWRS